MKRINIGILVIALAIPLLVGGASAAFSSQAMSAYGTMNKPPLSPPAWVFSVVWTILYIMMGLSSYYIVMAEADSYSKAVVLVIYGLQLLMNFSWSILFFNWEMYMASFIWLIMMWCLIIICAYRFYNISRIAAYLLIPYIAWTTFAAYLNFGAYFLKMEGK